ncbi:hypothetical protein [uncultured Methanolobus sp.]|uniref:hypothetical protein n=1 Tax=uncultured Methanolobus sp. TaxID=218300 RepID=UPI0029C893BD|nr:hypothetical protein [uncultured Methanolobus sp.]
MTVIGDIWELGSHRLLCGDSTDPDQVAKLMGEEKADMVFTDPPWNVNYGATKNPRWKQRSILNDAMETEDFKEFMMVSFGCMNQFSKDGCPTYVVMSAQEWGNMMLSLKENNYHWSSTIIWAKDRLVLSRERLPHPVRAHMVRLEGRVSKVVSGGGQEAVRPLGI